MDMTEFEAELVLEYKSELASVSFAHHSQVDVGDWCIDRVSQATGQLAAQLHCDGIQGFQHCQCNYCSQTLQFFGAYMHHPRR